MACFRNTTVMCYKGTCSVSRRGCQCSESDENDRQDIHACTVTLYKRRGRRDQHKDALQQRYLQGDPVLQCCPMFANEIVFTMPFWQGYFWDTFSPEVSLSRRTAGGPFRKQMAGTSTRLVLLQCQERCGTWAHTGRKWQ